MTRQQYRDRYLAYLRSPQWSAIRELRFILSDYHCDVCGNFVPKPHCHHWSYAKWFVFNEWQALHLLACLCPSCHRRIHKIKEPKKTGPEEDAR
jgi:hypothetical protein